jgi:hypothetical protein
LFEKAEKQSEDLDDLPVLNRVKTLAFLREEEASPSELYFFKSAQAYWTLYQLPKPEVMNT